MSTISKQRSTLSLLNLPVEINIIILCNVPLPTLDLLLAAHPYFRELWKISIENKRERDQRLFLTRREHVDQLVAASLFDPFYFSKVMLACSVCLKLRHINKFRLPWWGSAKQMPKRACADCQGDWPWVTSSRSLAPGPAWYRAKKSEIAPAIGFRCSGCNKYACTGVPLLSIYCLPCRVVFFTETQRFIQEQRTQVCHRCNQPRENCLRERLEAECEVEVEIAVRQEAIFDEERLKRFWNRPAEVLGYQEERATWRERLMYLWSVDLEHILDRRFCYTKPLKSGIKFDCSLTSTFESEYHRHKVIQDYASMFDEKSQYRWPCRLLANSFGQCSEEAQQSLKMEVAQQLRVYKKSIQEDESNCERLLYYPDGRLWDVEMKLRQDIRRLLGIDYDPEDL
ncbi:hypothetical protein MMC11_006427 [Xylographa trunciseda]|nr:hypothetical protein [Xylographa trunciseda]